MPWIPDHSTAIHTDETEEIEGLTEKTTPVDEDLVVIEDSEALYVKKKVQLANLPGGGGATELDDLTDVDLTGLATGDFLQYDGTDWVPVDEPSGSGLIFPAWINHLAERRPDETGHADDDFFDDDDHSAWTKQTVSGTAVWEELDGILSVNFASQTSGDLAAALLPLTSPSAPVTLEVALNAVTARADSYTYGIGFADGTGTGDDVALFRYRTASVASDDFFQTAGTLTDFAGGSNTALNDFRVAGGLVYLRIVWTTTNTFETQFSSNGRNWRNIGSTFTRTMTPTHAVLFGAAGGGGADGGVVSFHYLRRNDNDPT